MLQDAIQDSDSDAARRTDLERLLGPALRTAGVAVWDYDYATGRLADSPALAELFGLAPGCRLATLRDWEACVHPDDAAELDQLWTDAATAGRACAVEYRIAAAGSVRWVSASGTVVRDDQGRPVRAAGVVLDVTARRRDAQERERTERLFRAIAETTPGLAYVHDLAERRSVWANGRLQAVLGHAGAVRARDETDYLRLLHPDEGPAVLAELHAMADARDGEVRMAEFRARHADGSWRWFRDRRTVLQRDASGRVLRVLGLVEDVTEARRTGDALRDRDRHLAMAMTAARMGTWISHLDTGVIDATPSCKANLGLPPDFPLTRESLLQRIHPDDRARVRDRIRSAVETGREYETEYRAVWPDGSERWILSRGTVERDEAGAPRRLVGITLDLTEQRRAVAEREAALRGRAEALQELAHRVKNSLQVVASMIRLQATRSPEGPVRAALRGLFDRIAAISDAHARLYLGSVMGTLDFGAYVEDLCTRLSRSAPRPVQVSVPVRTIHLEADRAVPLGLVLSDLVGAALRSAAAAGAAHGVEVALSCEAAGCSLVVGGPAGLALEEEPGENGLGLTLVRSLVRQAGGTFALDGVARISLPRPEAP